MARQGFLTLSLDYRGSTENTATKAHLRAVLDVLAGRQADAALLKQIPNAVKLRAIRPEDLAMIKASSHGYTDSNGSFYLIPSDTGTAPLASPEFRSRSGLVG